MGTKQTDGVELQVDPEDWATAVTRVAGTQLVVGGPGTGKSEFLVRRAVHLMDEGDVAPEQILILGFSRRGVADLRNRIEARLDRSFTSIPTATFHSLASGLLELYGGRVFGWERLPTLLTAPEQAALVRDLLTGEDPTDWPHPFRPLLTTHTFADEVTDFILRSQEQLLTPEDLETRAADRADWKGLPSFYRRYLEELPQRGRIDYGTLLAEALRLLGDADVVAELGNQYSYLLVDEYQDTTTAQAELLQHLYRPSRNLTVAADPYQSIYSFRGAELHNVADFPAAFPDGSGAPATRLVLTTSFRVPKAIMDAAVRVTAGGDLPGAAGAVTPAPGDGIVETYGFQQQSEEAEWIAAELQRLHVEQHIAYADMGVFVRSKRRFLPVLSRALARRGIPHDPPDARLADHPAVRLVLDCVIAATEPGEERARAVRRILLGPLFTTALGTLRAVERERLREGTGWPQTIRRHVVDGADLAELLESPEWATTWPAVDGFWHLWSSLPQFSTVVTDAGRGDERAALASLAQVLGRLNERDPRATLADYLALTESEEFEARPLLSYQRPESDRLTVTTLHQSKGLEFEVVFIADATEGVFPDLRPRESMLGSRHLSPSLGGDAVAYGRFRLQEEMRLAYTAMTRARRRVVWTTTLAGVEESMAAPSRFLPLVAGVDAMAWATRPPVPWTQPATAEEADAWLRRIVRDDRAPTAQRLAAIELLADAASWGGRPADSIAGVRSRGSDAGLVPAGLSMSPSQAESYERCPRRYALERRLHVGDDRTVHLVFGNLVHDVLEQAERAAMADGRPHATLEEALHALEDHFDPAAFGGPPWAEAWRRRAVQALTRLYEQWPSTGEPIGLEHRLDAEIGGVVWSGRADRVERAGDALGIIDYKSSRNPMSLADAASSLQLGYYLIALAVDDELDGTPAWAELWYPVADYKSLTVRAFDVAKLPEVAERLMAAAEGIRAERWEPRPGDHCERCRLRGVCPAWPEGREAFQG